MLKGTPGFGAAPGRLRHLLWSVFCHTPQGIWPFLKTAQRFAAQVQHSSLSIIQKHFFRDIEIVLFA